MSERESEGEMEPQDPAGQHGEGSRRLARGRARPEDMKPDAALAMLARRQQGAYVQGVAFEERGRRRVADEVRARQDRASDDLVENQADNSRSDIEQEPRNRDQERDEGGLR